MKPRRDSSGRNRPARRAAIIGAAIAILFATPAPLHAADESGRASLLLEFSAICTELTQARDLLAQGELRDDQFRDRILDLFVRADSVACGLGVAPPTGRRDLRSFTLHRAVVYLIDSLRENYVGIVVRNGVRFVEADQALKAAVAWRSSAAAALP